MQSINILIFIFFVSLIIAILTKPAQRPAISKNIFIIALFLIMTGGSLFYGYCPALEKAFSKRSWPITTGQIDSSQVVGERAFRPLLYYHYYINGEKYNGITDLHVPGFGGRMNRLDAAEKLVKLYHPGKAITIHHDPDSPEISLIRTGPSYTDYLATGTGALLFLIGTLIFLMRMIQKVKNPTD